MGTRSCIVNIPEFPSSDPAYRRNIRIYLPCGYDSSKSRYPVLYLHDGGSVFSDNCSSISRASWRIDEVADRLIADKMIRPIIMVAIPNSRNRAGDYSHFSCKDREIDGGLIGKYTVSVEAKGIYYENFIINELKPYIDSNFRTMPDADNTAMLGSSMGGMVTYNIGQRNPDIFSMLGVMSPAFFWEKPAEIMSVGKGAKKIWMDIGECENNYIPHVAKAAEILVSLGYTPGIDFKFLKMPNAVHTETCWGDRVFMPLLYFFGRMGAEEKLELFGNTSVNLGEKVSLNAVITYSSGAMESILRGSYSNENADVVDVQSGGEITGKALGSSVVTVTHNDLSEAMNMTVCEKTKEKVTITVHVKVPDSTPYGDDVYISSFASPPIKMEKRSTHYYSSTFELPRDFIFAFRFKRKPDEFGFINNTSECDNDGEIPPVRIIRAYSDTAVSCDVRSWQDIR